MFDDVDRRVSRLPSIAVSGLLADYESSSFVHQESSNDSEFETTCLSEEEVASEVMKLAGNPTLHKLIRGALKMDTQLQNAKYSYADLQSLPKRLYLEHALLPILHSGLLYIVTVRPKDPIHDLAVFLLLHRSEFEEEDFYEPKIILSKSSSSRLTMKSRIAENMYVENTLVPILISGLTYVAETRPVSPITTLATFLLLNRSKYEEDDFYEPPKPMKSLASKSTFKSHKDFKDKDYSFYR